MSINFHLTSHQPLFPPAMTESNRLGFAQRLRGLKMLCLLFCLVVLSFAGPVSADTLVLLRGGEFEGTVTKEPDTNGGFYEFKLDSGVLMKINKSEVDRIVVPQESLASYQAELARVKPVDVAGHITMAEWCGANRLRRQQEYHRRKIIELDPNHRETRLLLGYSWNAKLSKWVVRDEFLQSIGYVRVGRNMRLPIAEQIANKQKEHKSSLLKWESDINRWLTLLNNERKFAEAKKNLEEIEDVTAVPVLIKKFEQRSKQKARSRLTGADRDVLVFLMERIASFDILSAKSFLVNQALSQSNETLRDEAELHLKQKHPEWTANYLINYFKGISAQILTPINERELAGEQNRIARAAILLRNLEVDISQATLPLINVLWVNRVLPPGAAPKKGIGGPIGFSNQGGIGNGMSMGSEKQKAKGVQIPNDEVLITLRQMTEQRFSFDKSQWINWYTSDTLPPLVDLRRLDD